MPYPTYKLTCRGVVSCLRKSAFANCIVVRAGGGTVCLVSFCITVNTGKHGLAASRKPLYIRGYLDITFFRCGIWIRRLNKPLVKIQRNSDVRRSVLTGHICFDFNNLFVDIVYYLICTAEFRKIKITVIRACIVLSCNRSSGMLCK